MDTRCLFVFVMRGTLLAFMLLLSACTPTPPTHSRGTIPSGDGSPPPGHVSTKVANGKVSSMWAAKPVAMRIYPSTRFVLEDDPILEARIELFDQMGDAIKSSGTVRCELYVLAGRDSLQVGPKLYHWDIELKTLADQQLYFDPITHGYAFRLKLDDEEMTRRPTLLRVVFAPPDGVRLKAEDRVRTDW